MIYLNSRQVAGFALGTVGFFWPWNYKWRYFFGMESGRAVSQEGPVWMTDDEAGSRGADIMERGLAHGRSISPLRYDWDDSARVWKRA